MITVVGTAHGLASSTIYASALDSVLYLLEVLQNEEVISCIGTVLSTSAMVMVYLLNHKCGRCILEENYLLYDS